MPPLPPLMFSLKLRHRGVGDVVERRDQLIVLDVAGAGQGELDAVLAGQRDHELGQRPDLAARLGVLADVLDEVHRPASAAHRGSA